MSHQIWDNADELWENVTRQSFYADTAFMDVMLPVDEGDEPPSKAVQRFKYELDGLELAIRVFRSETGV